MNTSARTRPPKALLASAIVEELKRAIQDGDLKPGERINEATLATQMGTSRGPIREAILGHRPQSCSDSRSRCRPKSTCCSPSLRACAPLPEAIASRMARCSWFERAIFAA